MKLPDDFHYLVEIDYCVNDYCRCQVITDARCTNPNYYNLYSSVVGKCKLSPIKKYVLDRVIRSLNAEDFVVNIRGGYYGEEIDSVTLNEEKRDKINAILADLEQMDDNKAVETSLIFEYGYLLDSVVGKKWRIEKNVPIDNITFGGNYEKINRNTTKAYAIEMVDNNEYGPAVLCLEQSGKFRLIDGRHRLAAAREIGRTTISVVCA